MYKYICEGRYAELGHWNSDGPAFLPSDRDRRAGCEGGIVSGEGATKPRACHWLGQRASGPHPRHGTGRANAY